MKTKDKITVGAISVFAIISIVLGAGLLNQKNVYICEESQIALICEKLSKINLEGIVTRCYFYSEELERETYKICNSGWIKFENNEIEGFTNATDFLCDDSKLIKECKNKKGKILLRVGI